MVMLPADHGTWGVGIVSSSCDRAIRAARDPEVWTRLVRSYPMVAHWLEGEPITDIDIMAGIHDVHRSYWRDGMPVVTGAVSVGDSWACTNPSLGRGATIGLRHAVALRHVLRCASGADALDFARYWHEVTEGTVGPLVQDTLAFDRHRLAEIEAQIEGRPYETEDQSWNLGKAVRAGAGSNPDLLRAAFSIASLLERAVDLLADPGLRTKAMAVSNTKPFPGPSRSELLGLLAA
jgi:hypothetical protein